MPLASTKASMSRQGFSGPAWRPAGVAFDGSTYLTRGADLTGGADGKEGIVCFSIKMSASDGANQTIFANTSALGSSFYCARVSSNVVQIVCGRAGSPSTLDLVLNGSTSINVAAGRKTFLCSWNAATASAWMYLGNTSDLAGGATINNQTLDYTGTGNFGIGAETDGGVKLSASLYDLYINLGTSLDFSVLANRRKFVDAQGNFLFLGKEGQLPTGTKPIIYLTGGASDWATNRGSGGNFSAAAGSLTTVPWV